MSDENIKQSILEKIKTDEVKMTPRQFFLMKWLTLGVMSVFFLGLAIYFLAYVIFLFVDNGLVYIPLFTNSGIVDFIVEIPWTLVLLGLLCIFLFSITSKTFYKLYRRPFLAFFFSILLAILLSQVILVQTGGMNYLKEEAYKERWQLVPSKLLEFRDSQTGNLFVGYVVSTTTNSLIIRDRKNNLLELVAPEGLDLKAFLPGQLINAYGQMLNGKVELKSIEIVR
jgi:hypothetical protein